jgi:hypothetical protein
MSYVREAVLEHVHACCEEGNQVRGNELSRLEPRLPVSQIGHCPRQAIFEAVRYHPDHPLHADTTHPFGPYVEELLECGNVWEHQTGRALSRKLGDKVYWHREDPVLRVGNQNWFGHIDFLVEPCDAFPNGAIIEHKATNPVNFKVKGRLPYDFHCLQVLTYRDLLRQKLDEARTTMSDIPAYLYYRSWANWAELQVWSNDGSIIWEGEINGKWKSGEFEIDLDEEMEALEYYWRNQELPPRYETPMAVRFSCAKERNGDVYPDCRYFGVCWPELPQRGPFNAEAM